MAEERINGRFAPGTSGNPKGRPKKEREEQYLHIALSAVSFHDWREIIKKAAAQAKRGDAVARKWLGDYLMGAPIQRTELTGEGGNAVVIKVVYEGASGASADATPEAG